MLDGVLAAPPQPPSAFCADEQPGDAAPGWLAVHHIEIAVGGQHAGRAVGGILVVGGVLVAEPERQPGAVGRAGCRAR